ncbi:fibronectin type III domain-containing protein [bacterium]|nr:fibronectin type III domain-containing protein [bacterium]
MRSRLLIIVAWGIASVLAAGCQGSNVTGGLPPAEQTVASPAPGQWPAFPGDSTLPDAARQVSLEDNVVNGSDRIANSDTGAAVNFSRLELRAPDDGYAWGLWCWGEFEDELLPRTLAVDVVPQTGSEYWLLLSNYSDQTWEILGPLTAINPEHDYSLRDEYRSALGYTYVAIVAAPGQDVDVVYLNLQADKDVTPPQAPQNLGNYAPLSTSITLTWDQNEENDLFEYYIYSGPEPDFDVHAAEADKIGEATAVDKSFGASGLTPGTTYHFRITALDLASNESQPSNTATAATPLADPQPPPTDLTVEAYSSLWADLSWTAPDGDEPLGYEVYTGPEENFAVGDPGVVKRNPNLITATSWRLNDLEADTLYYIGVRAYHLNTQSPLSNTPSFTTETSVAPEPAFTYLPVEIRNSESVTFDPSPTTDVDTPLDELICKWDFDNSGTVDKTTVGLESVEHTYTRRGPVTCKLTVSDGNSVSTIQPLTVGLNFDYAQGATSTGLPGTVVQVDTWPADEQLGCLFTYGDNALVRFFDGTSWNSYYANAITPDYYCDVALRAPRLSLLAVDQSGGNLTWTVYDHASGNLWTANESQAITADHLVDARLDANASGRIAVALLAGVDNGGDIDYTLHVWHEQSGGSFSTDSVALGTNVELPFDVFRGPDSYFVYCLPGEVRQWSFTDSSDTDQPVQTYTGTARELVLGGVAPAFTELYWALATSSQIYYGDNYGSANGSQQIALPGELSGLLGVGLDTTADNEAVVYWTDFATDGRQHLHGYSSVADDWYTLAEGAGIAQGGAGAYTVIDGQAGVYVCHNEVRDGECYGQLLNRADTYLGQTHFAPQGSNSITAKHQTVLLTDSSVLCLSGQTFPTARASKAALIGQSFTSETIGQDAYCQLDTACTMSYAKDYLVGSYTPEGNLVTTWFLTDLGEIDEVAVYAGTSLARLEYNPYNGANILVYATDGSTDLAARSWNGLDWSEPATIHTGTAEIEALTVSGKPDFQWGVAWIDTTDAVRLAETAAGVWQAPEVLSTEVVNGPAGLGLDYHAGGHVCLAVERQGGSPGVYLGQRLAGQSLTWELAAATDGTSAESLYAYYHLTKPVVLFYEPVVPLADSRMQFVEYLGGAWIKTPLDGELHGAPVSARRNLGGDIVITGYTTATTPYRAAVGIINH